MAAKSKVTTDSPDTVLDGGDTVVAKAETPPEPATEPPVTGELPAVRVARSFADAAAHLLGDATLDPGTQRKGVMAALANVAMALDQTLPDTTTEEDTPPAWATAMIERLSAVEKALQANVGAGSQTTPETGDNLGGGSGAPVGGARCATQRGCGEGAHVQ